MFARRRAFCQSAGGRFGGACDDTISRNAREREEAAGSGPRLLPRSGHSSNLQSTVPPVTDHFPWLLGDRHVFFFPVAGADELLVFDRAPAALAHQLLPRDVFPAAVADD